MPAADSTLLPTPDTGRLIGLAALARQAFAGADLTPVRTLLLERIARDENDAGALMDLSTVMHLMGQRECGLSLQTLALQLRQSYFLPAAAPAPAIRLLAFVCPGDLSENNALEFLLETSDVTLHHLYVDPRLPLPGALPDHDLAMVAVSESDRNRPLLSHIATLVEAWPRPVICAPGRIARLSRDGACGLLGPVPGVVMPRTLRVGRDTLERMAAAELLPEALLPDGGYPIILRPVDSQKGQGLMQLPDAAAVREYLEKRAETAFYLARYVDYRSADGQFRKYRIVLIDGRPYACHMAVSDSWMVHYMSAGMVENAQKRAEEARFFDEFDRTFASRHSAAISAIAQRLELEYVGLDCGETPAGELLIFEIDSGMTVHAMDPVDIFPYKQPQMRKVFRAFRDMLAARCR